MPFRNFLIYGSLVRLALLLKVVLYSVLFLSGILLFLLSLLHFQIYFFFIFLSFYFVIISFSYFSFSFLNSLCFFFFSCSSSFIFFLSYLLLCIKTFGLRPCSDFLLFSFTYLLSFLGDNLANEERQGNATENDTVNVFTREPLGGISGEVVSASGLQARSLRAFYCYALSRPL